MDPSDLFIGAEASFERMLSQSDIDTFAENSGDRNPLHVDAAYAAMTNFRRPIVHGAFQIGLASAMLGMFLPGRRVLLMSVQSRFPAPLFCPCRVRVRGVISSWDSATHKGVVRTTVEDMDTGRMTAEVHTGFTFHDHTDVPATGHGKIESSRAATSSAVEGASRPIVLVTGASGGVGSAIARELATDHLVLALSRHRPLPEDLQTHPFVQHLSANLADDAWESIVEIVLNGRPLHAVVHAAWPGAPQGGLLDVPLDTVAMQVAFGSTYLIRLARLLSTSATDGGRLVAIGSSYGLHSPNFSLASYSLGKATLEHTVSLLAPDLAKRRITVNAVTPSVLASGLNAHITERQQLREVAKIPLGRLCEESDVIGLVRFLLSPDASFISGQSIRLTGAQL